MFLALHIHQEILKSMNQLQTRQLIPFLSPMLENDLDQSSTTLIHARNRNIIYNCINIVTEGVPYGERSLAIKLTAFMSPSWLVSTYLVLTPYKSTINLMNFRQICTVRSVKQTINDFSSQNDRV
jgi:hypothetical protein